MVVKGILAIVLMCLFFPLRITSAENSTIRLSYEAQDTLLHILNATELDNLDTSNRSIIPIYRKDLDQGYIAYYQISLHGRQYLILSSGPKSGDYKKAQSGPPPLPTRQLDEQAEKAGQKCQTYFLLSSAGIYMCENNDGKAVAATYNWTSDTPISDWKKIQELVDQSLNGFKTQWQNVASSSKDDWITSYQIKGSNEEPGSGSYAATTISPGEKGEVALGGNHRMITVHAIPETRQIELCSILVNVCRAGSNVVNQKRIHQPSDRINYLEFQVNSDSNYVYKILKNKDVSFFFKIETDEGQQVAVYFFVNS